VEREGTVACGGGEVGVVEDGDPGSHPGVLVAAELEEAGGDQGLLYGYDLTAVVVQENGVRVAGSRVQDADAVQQRIGALHIHGAAGHRREHARREAAALDRHLVATPERETLAGGRIRDPHYRARDP